MKRFLPLMIAAVSGAVVGYSVSLLQPVQPKGEPIFSAEVRDKIASTQFTSPLLECAEPPEHLSIKDRVSLQSDIEVLLEKRKNEGVLLNAAIYYRDLNNGPWFGIDEDKKFSPASLLKVPLAMWYYWEADTNPGILEEKIEYVGPSGTSIVYFPPKKKIEVNKVYSIDELISLMLEESDNEATKILGEFAGQERVARVYGDIGIEPAFNSSTYEVDVHTYASFFRILYNATYLGRSHSETLLETMSNSSFIYGLVAGVPKGVRVSHKFGEKTVDLQKQIFQLHDCGIVYAIPSPYVLCVMTQGRDYDELAGVIREISAMVYDEVKNK